MPLACWAAKKCVAKCQGQQNMLSLSTVLCINICTQNLSLHLVSEMQWYPVSILTHIEKTSKTEILKVCFTIEILSYVRRQWKMLHIFDRWYNRFIRSWWWQLYAKRKVCPKYLDKQEKGAKTASSPSPVVLLAGMSLRYEPRYVYLLNILTQNKTKQKVLR